MIRIVKYLVGLSVLTLGIVLLARASQEIAAATLLVVVGNGMLSE